MTSRIFTFFVLLAIWVHADAQDYTNVEVQGGDTQGLIDAINQANTTGLATRIVINPGPGGETEFEFDSEHMGSDGALPNITGHIKITGNVDNFNQRFTFKPKSGNEGDFRLARITGGGKLVLEFIRARNFGSTGDGGALLVDGNSSLWVISSSFLDNTSATYGGAIAARDTSGMLVIHSRFRDNGSDHSGGAISVIGAAEAEINRNLFEGNSTRDYGCDVLYNTTSGAIEHANTLINNQYDNRCSRTSVSIVNGIVTVKGNTFRTRSPFDGIESMVPVVAGQNVIADDDSNQQAQLKMNSGPEASCSDTGGADFQSVGGNITYDNSCGFDHPTDITNTDPRLEEIEDDIYALRDDSPAIDSGATEAIDFGDGLVLSPCSHADITGTARPQDANGDGVFECDRGSWEKAGAGAVVSGHSGAFFNPERDKEGTYVEILNEDTAIVYTFTYRPDGSGPAWFIGVGDIRGNGIVIDELLRPIGTSFGAGFDATDIDFTFNGGMSMVFPDCNADAPGGVTNYDPILGLDYEGLITRASRLGHITGCGSQTPSDSAGLSGSYFDPARNGEGVIVQWLTSGQVLVVFFTFDQNDNQLWVLGIGTPDEDGKSVTMEALYATTYSPWGRNYNPMDVTLSPWGSFTLTWTECGGVRFDYDGSAAGYGTGGHDYSRLSTIAGTSCPSFD